VYSGNSFGTIYWPHLQGSRSPRRDQLVVPKRRQGITTIRCVNPDEFRSRTPIQTVPGAVRPDAMHSKCTPDQLLPFATMLQTGGVIPPFPHLYP